MRSSSAQAWIVDRGRIEIRESRLASPSPGEAVVATHRVGICGTDTHALAHGHPRATYPICPGHEAVGAVVETGDEVTEVTSGDLVYLNPMVTCNDCAFCRSGRPNLCVHRKAFGVQLPGAMARLFIVPARQLRIVPNGLSVRQASLLEPLAAAVHAVRQPHSLSGASIAVLGTGAMGLCVVAASHLLGAGQVVACDVRDTALSVASRLGAQTTINVRDANVAEEVRAALQGAPDVIFDCVGAPSTLEAAHELATPGGAIVLVGAPEGGVGIPAARIQNSEITVRGSSMYVMEDFAVAELLMPQALHLESVVTGEYALEQTAGAFDAAAKGNHIKVQVLPLVKGGDCADPKDHEVSSS